MPTPTIFPSAAPAPTPTPVPTPAPAMLSAFCCGVDSNASIPLGICEEDKADVFANGSPVCRFRDEIEIPGVDICLATFVCTNVLADDRGVARQTDFGIGQKKGFPISPAKVAGDVLVASTPTPSPVPAPTPTPAPADAAEQSKQIDVTAVDPKFEGSSKKEALGPASWGPIRYLTESGLGLVSDTNVIPLKDMGQLADELEKLTPSGTCIAHLTLIDHGGFDSLEGCGVLWSNSKCKAIGQQAGSDFLMDGQLSVYRRQLARIRQTLCPGATVTLGGCAVGTNKKLLKELSAELGAPVTASTTNQSVLPGTLTGSTVTCDPSGACSTDIQPPLESGRASGSASSTSSFSSSSSTAASSSSSSVDSGSSSGRR